MLDRGYILKAYEIHSVVGRGGFGIVYKGRHQELEIDVAIKEYFPAELSIRRNGTVLPSRPEFQASFEDGLVRFLAEAKQLENLRDSPNIVTCRDLFRANGTAYMVMEYVSGLPLSVLLEQRESHGAPLTEQELLELIRPLLTGLTTVHESGVCHRDIKPSNILIRHSDHVSILIDFGAAKHEISRHTKSFAPYTDGYAAMEQIGEGEIGPWTDLYGLGAVMWRIVAGGSPPFSPPNPLTSQKRAFELMQGRADPMPSAKEIGRNRFSAKLLHAIDDCLILNINERVQNCDKLLEKLDKSERVVARITDRPSILEEENKLSNELGLNQTNTEQFKERYRRKYKQLPLTLGLIGGVLLLFFVWRAIYQNPQGSVRRAAEQGNAEAQFNLGKMYAIGEDVPENREEAVKWFRLAAEQGYTGAQHILSATEQGLAEVQHSLGDLYNNGWGVPEDDQEAVKWYSLAAEQGHAEALSSLVDTYYSLGGTYYSLGLEDERRDLYDISTGQGYHFCVGYESDQETLKEAVKWYRLAAVQEHAEAQYSLGGVYYCGRGVPRDKREAVRWYRLAAEQGLAEAQFVLGEMYNSDSGMDMLPEGDQEAVKWYSLAAEQGFSWAQFRLGEMYLYGRGVPMNRREADKWYRLAREQGYYFIGTRARISY